MSNIEPMDTTPGVSTPNPNNSTVAGNLKRYFKQLTQGCGAVNCTNQLCASNPKYVRQDPTSTAVRALNLAKESAQFLCPSIAAEPIETAPTSTPSPSSSSSSPSSSSSTIPPPPSQSRTTPQSAPLSIPSKSLSQPSPTPMSTSPTPMTTSPIAKSPIPKPPLQYFDLPLLERMIGEAQKDNNFTPLIRKIGQVFSDTEGINNSFLRPVSDKEPNLVHGKVFYSLDIASVRAAYKMILDMDREDLNNALIGANGRLASQLKHEAHRIRQPEDLRQFIILYENPQLIDPETHREILGPLLSSTAALPPHYLTILQEWFSGYDSDQFRKLVGLVQQFITIYIITANPLVLNKETFIVAATKVLALLHPINEKYHHVPYTEFYNEMVNDRIELKEDYINWKHDEGFTFCHYPFVLDPGVKSKVLQIESYMQMRQQRAQAFNMMLMTGVGTAPYLVFRVRRDHLIPDTITQIALHPPEDLRKELKVQFTGEEGIDQGGVQKEFFQLIVRSIFDPDYGMFTQTKGNLYWFNRASFNELSDFKLIGTILGLALYNSVILDAKFPEAVYKKLINVKPTLDDLRDVDLELLDGLKKLLAYTGDDAEDVFGLTFQVTYEAYGETRTYDLKEGGGDLPVTSQNKQEYVDLLVHYYLDSSVKKLFDAFLSGFKAVCNSPAFDLFRWEELELLICGSPELDFEELEKSAQYEGYDENHPVIKNFWEVVHSLPLEQKKKLLFFTTGSDRSPIGGLGKLHLVITRHGPDSDRLPSAHTCFNHLLIPEYSTKEKLQERLVAAISNSEGFGLM